jgi:predicted dehydrogenase
MQPGPFRVALVGLGFAACQLHLPALATLPDAAVVGACDHDSERRADVARRWKIPTFDNFDRMMSSARPEVVVIATPPHTHADYCRRSLVAGAHVFCEKPFVSSLAEADLVLDAANRAGRSIGLNHEFREMPIFRTVLKTATAPNSGDVRFVQVSQFIDLPPSEEAGWRGRLGHRGLYEAGVHLVDYVLAVFGQLPGAVSATLSPGSNQAAQRDAISLVTLEFSDGRLAQLTQYRLAKGEQQYFEARVETDRETLRASFGGRARLSVGLYRSTRPHLRLEFGMSGLAWRETHGGRVYLARNPRQPREAATRALVAKTLRAFREGTPPPVSGMDGRNALKVIAACYQAAARGSRVQLDVLDDSPDLASLPMGTPSAMEWSPGSEPPAKSTLDG